MGDRVWAQLPIQEIYLGLTNHPGQLSLAIPPWAGIMSISQAAVMLCDWEIKEAAGVWCQVNLCDPL